MKPAVEFDEIHGRFEPIDDMLFFCRERADETQDLGYATLVAAVQRLSNEVQSLERKLMADDRGF